MQTYIKNIMTISSNHISFETAHELLRESMSNRLGLSVYLKSDSGFFILCPKDMTQFHNENKSLPIDLWKCLEYANKNHCQWLCLDRNGEQVDELENYNNVKSNYYFKVAKQTDGTIHVPNSVLLTPPTHFVGGEIKWLPDIYSHKK